MMAVFSEMERDAISKRTKEAMAPAKARGGEAWQPSAGRATLPSLPGASARQPCAGRNVHLKCVQVPENTHEPSTKRNGLTGPLSNSMTCSNLTCMNPAELTYNSL